MRWRTGKLAGAVVLTGLAWGLLAVWAGAAGNGQGAPSDNGAGGSAPAPGSAAASGTRDAFGPNASRQSRLSRAEFVRATEQDQDEDEVPAKKAPPPTVAAALAGPLGGIPVHRLSRDVAAHPMAAAHHGPAHGADWSITLKNAFIEKYKN